MAPRVFLSSTILDLRDLRSAVRYFLEQYGFEVLNSEAADFPHDLESEAWKAALVPIETAEYFVLLIGERSGWITPSGASVTHEEFRRARVLNRSTGRPKIVVLSRDDTLRAYRSGAGVPAGTDGWGGVVALLDEVHHPESETDTTWVHPFDTFEDIATTLRTALTITGPLRRRVQETNLIEELFTCSEALLIRIRGTVAPCSALVASVPRSVEALTRETLTNLVVFRLVIPGPGRISTTATDQAIFSGEFLEFQPETGAMSVGPLQRELLRLRARVGRYETLQALLQSDPYQREFARMTPNGGAQTPSQTFLEILLAVRDELQNMEMLMRALARHLIGVDVTLTAPTLNAPSPDPEEAGRIAAETIGRDAVYAWLGVVQT